MSLLFKLGWRNIWRNKRRSIITILAVVFAVMLSIVMRAIQLGTYEVNIRHVVELFSGYIQIQMPGYQKSPTLQKSFHNSDSLQALLQQRPEVIASAPRVIGDGLTSFRDNSQGALLVGVDPLRERNVSKLDGRVVHGRFLDPDRQDAIVVGDKLLQNLHAQIGDTIVVLAQGFDGSMGNLKYVIIGSVKTGLGEFDRSLVLMNLAAAQDLMVMYGRANVLAVRLHDLDEIQDVQQALQPTLKRMGLRALSWSQVMPDLEQSIKLDNISGILMLGILVFVVAFGITNTVLMSVTERFREFGIVLSIGMQQQKLVFLVFLETIMILLVGLIIGNLCAYGINYYLHLHPIEFTGEFADIYAEYGFLPRLEATLRFSSFFNTTLSIFGISILATLYPVAKVLKLEPLKGIRYT